MTGHRIGAASLPAVELVVWACTCGAGQVLEYRPSAGEEWTLRLAADRAAKHAATFTETPDRSEPT